MILRSNQVWNFRSKKFEEALLFLKGEKIQKILWGKAAKTKEKYRDLGDLKIGPSAIDLHIHSRDFLETHKETFETLEAGAFAGGVSYVVCMANTQPRLDEVERVKNFLNQAAKRQLGISCFAAVTKNLEGREATDWSKLLKLPVAGLSDDGKPLLDVKMMEACLKKIKPSGKLFSLHEENTGISCGSVLHLSESSMRLGVSGSPEEAESEMVERDLRLAAKHRAHLHFCHISSARSVKLFEKYRKKASFSVELTPHHALLNVQFVETLPELERSLFKVCPVIREESDRQALLKALKSGVIDCFASDHAPHSSVEKELALGLAAHGIISLEMHYPLYLQVREEAQLSWDQFFSALSERPAKLLRLDRRMGRLQEGLEASFVVFDSELQQKIHFQYSKSRNSPLKAREIRGKVVEHWIKGSQVYAA